MLNRLCLALIVMCALALPACAQERLLLDDGMPLIITPVNDISSARNKAGDAVDFVVVHRCKVDGKILIDKDAIVHATVTKAEHSKMFGRSGVLQVAFATTSAIDGSPIKVRAQLGKKGNQAQDTATRLAHMLPYGVGLAFNGKDAILKAGVPLTIFVDENVVFAISPGRPPKRIGSSPGKSEAPRPASDETAR
jgi:hypothetical protein